MAIEIIDGQEYKRCSKCETVKPIIEFFKLSASKDGYHGVCKKCKKLNRKTMQEYLENLKQKRYVTEKLCSKCKIIKSIKDFYFYVCHNGYKHYASWCKECDKKNRLKNKEKISLHHKKYYQENKEKIKEYFKNNKEHYNELKKKYRETNKEHLKEYAKNYYEKYYKENKEKIIKNVKKHREHYKKYHKKNRIRIDGNVYNVNTVIEELKPLLKIAIDSRNLIRETKNKLKGDVQHGQNINVESC